MFFAATAASGGTGAPEVTYVSTCACTLRINASTSTPVTSGVSTIVPFSMSAAPVVSSDFTLKRR